MFPRPLWFHTTECCGAVCREPACVASKVCQLGDCEDRLSACAACYSPARVLVLLSASLFSMLSGEIYLRLNEAYLVVKISSDIVTEHCCQVCVLSMMFCRSVAVCWHGKWLRNQQETPRSTHVNLNCGRAHIMMINQRDSVLHAFSVPNWLEMCGVVDVLTVLLLSPTR